MQYSRPNQVDLNFLQRKIRSLQKLPLICELLESPSEDQLTPNRSEILIGAVLLIAPSEICTIIY